jgi:hypothetical protein
LQIKRSTQISIYFFGTRKWAVVIYLFLRLFAEACFLQLISDAFFFQVRIIVNTGVAVLESVTNLDKLFYHTLPGRGEFANVMAKEDNVDFHLLIDQVSAAKLVKGKSARGDIPTYMIRFVDGNGSIAVSLLVMWRVGTDGDYDHGQVEAFESLLEKYGPEIQFSS